jgi:hypothetical protein
MKINPVAAKGGSAGGGKRVQEYSFTAPVILCFCGDFTLILKQLSAFYSFTVKKRDFGDSPNLNPTDEDLSLTPNVRGNTGIFPPISIVRRRRVILRNERR